MIEPLEQLSHTQAQAIIAAHDRRLPKTWSEAGEKEPDYDKLVNFLFPFSCEERLAIALECVADAITLNVMHIETVLGTPLSPEQLAHMVTTIVTDCLALTRAHCRDLYHWDDDAVRNGEL